MSDRPMVGSGPDPLVVISAPNGARLDKSGHRAVPLTATEIAECAQGLVEQGVSVLHLHVRDERGAHVLDVGRYRDAMAAVRERVGRRLVLQATTEAVGQYDRQQQMALVRELRPEAVSLALRELCPDAAAEAEAGAFFRELADYGSWPQYILYSAGECRRFEALRQSGFFGTERPFALFVLGRYGDSLKGDPRALDDFLETFRPGAFPWSVCCFGPAECEAVCRAAAAGGHVRIGFENNQLLPDGTVARDNAELVAAELALLDRSGIPKRPIASGDWVRTQLAGGQ
ncbi:MAG: 3-keto-5-aminohexanoate cleavage protein [Xanthomonadales bacterium]|nr:3-keto-5-aminohexanoate cleavage protein [Xanthomonadales bacterium]